MGRLCLAILSLVLLAHAAASQPISMTDTEMRATYCLPVVKNAIDVTQSTLSTAQAAVGPLEAAEKSRPLSGTERYNLDAARLMLKSNPLVLQNLQQAHTRLYTYLMARGVLAGGRGSALLAITNQAEQDQAACSSEPVKVGAIQQCMKQCKQGDEKCGPACFRANRSPTCNKVADCMNPDFLPF
jgi:hypothetical protein